MRPAPTRILLLAACVLAVSSLAWADVINFNNLPGDGTAVPTGYAGFNWHNFYDMSMNAPTTQSANLPMTGGTAGNLTFAIDHAGSNSAFSTGVGSFSFDSAWFQSMGANPVAIQVEAELHGVVVDSKVIVVTGGSTQLETFNWSGINEVRFTPIATASTASAMQFAVTNLVVNAVPVPVVPEPSTLLLLGSSLGFVITQMRRRVGK